MIKTKIQIDVDAVTNEIVSRFDAGVDNISSGSLFDRESNYICGNDDLSNIANDAVRTLLNELNEELG